MIYNIRMTQQEVPYRNPVLYNLVFGHKGGMQPNMECLTAFRAAVPADALWGVTHYGRDNWEFLAAAIAMGAAVVRIGFEDSRYLAPGRTACANYEEVEKKPAAAYPGHGFGNRITGRSQTDHEYSFREKEAEYSAAGSGT